MMRTRRLFWMPLLLALAGCGEEPRIIEQTVPRVNVAQRFLAAIVVPPVKLGNDMWYFSVSAKEPLIIEQRDAFEAFIRSLEFRAGEKPAWKAPAGWTEEPGNELRFATFFLGPRPNNVELLVTRLPTEVKPSDPDFLAEVIHPNINRWRQQIGAKGLADEDLEDFYRIDAKSLPGSVIYWVDMLGPSPRRSAAPMPPKQQQPEDRPLPFKYEVPEGWKKLPGDRFSFLTLATLEDDQVAKLTVSPLPSPQDLLANVNRWRGQLGLKEISAAQLDRDRLAIRVAGKPAVFVDVRDDNPAAGKNRILGVILPEDRQTWFFKLTGPAAFLEKQKSKFDAFLQSIAWTE